MADNEVISRILVSYEEKKNRASYLRKQRINEVREKYREIARAMGVAGVDNMTQEEYRKAAVNAVAQLSKDVGIPENLKDIVKEEDIHFLAESAVADACAPGNPKEVSLEDIIAMYKSLL